MAPARAHLMSAREPSVSEWIEAVVAMFMRNVFALAAE